MDVLDVGRMAVFIGPDGGSHRLVATRGPITVPTSPTSAGTFTWNELQTRDTEAAKAFYRAVFGWDADTSQDGPDGVHGMEAR